MKGYVVCVYKSIGDEKLLKKYAESAIPAIEKYKGKIIVRGGKKLTIEGILMSMYDVRLRLSNQVVEEVQTHFKNLVFNTIIPRNVKLSEAPSFGIPVISYDASCKGSISYLNLAKEVVDKNDTVKVEW